MEETKYADVFIYVPSVREIVRVAEGNGMNLLDEDEAEGYGIISTMTSMS
ncbi:hypothetical protein [Mediterraneibacter gnavus]|nr:hypothetical protein [Mediterraneibacter gnavus]MDB8718874.1 hypothetical protein [Mediterraneibacter gnavus]